MREPPLKNLLKKYGLTKSYKMINEESGRKMVIISVRKGLFVKLFELFVA